MKFRLSVFVCTLLITIGVGKPAHADSLLLTYTGTAVDSNGNVSTLNGDSIAGDTFDIQAEFNTVTSCEYGCTSGYFRLTSLTVEIDTTTYDITEDLSNYQLVLGDSTGFPGGVSYAWLSNQGVGSSNFTPEYSSTTPADWSADAPTPVTFNDFTGAFDNSQIFFDTTAGPLNVNFNQSGPGPNASISDVTPVVPEPPAFSLALLGLIAFGLVGYGRRVATMLAR
jgi:hypothetical protein